MIPLIPIKIFSKNGTYPFEGTVCELSRVPNLMEKVRLPHSFMQYVVVSVCHHIDPVEGYVAIIHLDNTL